jgi:4-amino-4-deoxy-L-arabinose transferase-like glycosyltransferase
MIGSFVLFIISLIMVWWSAKNQLKILGLTHKVEKVLAFMLLAAANIVLSTYILSEFSFISASGYIIIHTFFALISWLLQLKLGKHVKAGEIEPDRQSSPVGYLPKWLLIGLFIVILFTTLISFFLSVYVPPNNWDSMAYHLSRVGYWLQHGSLHHYYTHKWTQNALPPNAEIVILWSVAFLKSDILANLVQWTAYWGIGLAIYLIAGILGHSHRTSLFASLIFLSLPMVVLQSSTTQNDLVVTLFALSFFYFFHSGLKQRNHKKLILSGAALGLAVGTKLTIFFMLPALGISSLFLLKTFKEKISLYAHWCVFCIVGILVLGAYNYLQNYRSYGNPVSPPQRIAALRGEVNIEKAFLNAIRFGYDACDFRGLPPPLESFLFNLKDSFGKQFFSNPNITRKYTFIQSFSPSSRHGFRRVYHEDFGWFGIIGFYLYFPAAAWFFFRMFYKSTADERWAYAFAAVFFFIFICFMQKYDANKGRYFILPMAFIAPIAVSFTKIKNKKLIVIAASCISLAAAITSVNAVVKNRRKPILPVTNAVPNNIFNANFYQKRAGVGAGSMRVAPFLQFIEEAAPAGSRIGHILTLSDWDYQFFGRNFSREVIPIKPTELKKGVRKIIKKNKLDFLIISINKVKAINSNDLVLPANHPKGYFRIIPADISITIK